MKKIYITQHKDEIEKIFLLDIENNLQYEGSRKIKDYFKPIDENIIQKSHIISDEKFEKILNLKFLNIIKISYSDFMKKYELEEYLI